LKNNVLIGNRIRVARENIGKTQKEFAPMIGVLPTHLNRWELGKVSPGWEYLTIIAEKTYVSLDWLLADKGSMQRARLEEDYYAEYTKTALAKIKEKTGIDIDEKEKEFLLNVVRKMFSDTKNQTEVKLTDFIKIMGK
jgi:transcriptional regulator with XRE-family HTH domain